MICVLTRRGKIRHRDRHAKGTQCEDTQGENGHVIRVMHLMPRNA